jgi:hypothetical protein
MATKQIMRILHAYNQNTESIQLHIRDVLRDVPERYHKYRYIETVPPVTLSGGGRRGVLLNTGGIWGWRGGCIDPGR